MDGNFVELEFFPLFFELFKCSKSEDYDVNVSVGIVR